MIVPLLTASLVAPLVACGMPLYSDEQVEAALSTLKPSGPSISQGEWLVRCALEAGYSGELNIDAHGSVESRDESDRDREIFDGCLEEREEVFVFPDIEDERLENTAMYELQVLAAECVKTKLGLDPQLPTLDYYLESDGNWNMYDALEPADEEEWNRWNAACPQDLWTYYDG
jgi:hypothetical protein